MRTAIGTTIQLVLLPILAAGLWLLWAQHEYRGLDYCPWDSAKGHPVLVAVALVLASVISSLFPKRVRAQRGFTVAVPVATAMLAGAAVLVTALFFGAGLRCTD
jgi:hypothetical protein